MMKVNSQEPFEALPMPRKDIPQPANGSYKVFKNSKEFVVVAAASALEALQASGVESAYKIERESIDYIRVLSPSDWAQFTGESLTKETVLIQEQPAVIADVPPEILSNDDVNKLLNG